MNTPDVHVYIKDPILKFSAFIIYCHICQYLNYLNAFLMLGGCAESFKNPANFYFVDDRDLCFSSSKCSHK